jgi:hypothetical protein
MAFKVDSIFEVTAKDDGLSGYDITEKQVDKSYIKNFDEGTDDLFEWIKSIDTSKWVYFVIYDNKKPAAGAIIAFD